jgi:hypothetical protein
MYKMCAAFIVSLGVALTLASSQSFGGARGAHGGASASTHPTFRPSAARLAHHRQGRNKGAFFPGVGGFFWDPSYGQPGADFPQPMPGPTSNDINYTYKVDVPWDWAHRFPPGFFASSAGPHSAPLAYAPGCSTQTVTVPGADGNDQTVNLTRC